MKKRIRVHELKVGMFIDELEESVSGERQVPCLISSDEDVLRILNSNAISLVIDLEKGHHAATESAIGQDFSDSNRLKLYKHLPKEAVIEATTVIARSAPEIRRIMADACLKNLFRMDLATEVSDALIAMTSIGSNALIQMARLKRRDEYTFLHSLSVSALMVSFGRHLQVDNGLLRLMGIGGLVHDIGKMALPKQLLQKTGKLTAEEMGLVKTHPLEGFNIVRRLSSVPSAVLDICLYHHERYDGSGYPARLQGTEIPLVARVAAICDVYDALISIRPYKCAFSQEEAIEVMTSATGHFDTELLDIFVRELMSSQHISKMHSL